MSSHREAPEISKDPVADNADVYAFVSPDDPTRSRSSPTTCRSRGRPAGRTSSSSATTSSTRSTSTTTATRCRTSTYQFQFHTTLQNPDTFLYNTGPIGSLDDPNWNKRQFYSVYVIHSQGNGKEQDHEQDGHGDVLGEQPRVPAVQHRAALDAELRRARRGGGAHAAARRRRCSPASGTTASSSTSARSSTSATSGRSRTST